VEDGLVRKRFHQPYKDEKVEGLCADSEPIDEHRLLPRGLGDDVVPEGVGEIRIIDTTKQ